MNSKILAIFATLLFSVWAEDAAAPAHDGDAVAEENDFAGFGDDTEFSMEKFREVLESLKSNPDYKDMDWSFLENLGAEEVEEKDDF